MPESTQDDWQDIGHDCKIQRRYFDGDLHGIGLIHQCNDGPREDYIPCSPAWPAGWQVLPRPKLTLFPAIRCAACGWHGYVTNGRWCPEAAPSKRKK